MRVLDLGEYVLELDRRHRTRTVRVRNIQGNSSTYFLDARGVGVEVGGSGVEDLTDSWDWESVYLNRA